MAVKESLSSLTALDASAALDTRGHALISDLDSMKKAWDAFAGAVTGAAKAAARGIGYVYTKGDENKHYVIPAVNGIIGDKLAEMKDPRAISMSLRLEDRDVSVEEALSQLKDQLPRTFVVFVHGLMADEVLFQTHSNGPGYGPRLATDAEAAVFYVRYNSGRHISENGQDLSRLLESLTTAAGSRMKRLVIVAHSMGGLVSRSAGYYADLAGSSWIRTLSDVVLVGVPNDGSYLEKFGHLATFILKQIWNYPTRLVGRIADERSSGIKDLRWGFMVEDDWKHENADALTGVKRTAVPPLAGVKYHVLLGSLTKDVDSPLAMYFGDGLVGTRSAAGASFALPSNPEKPVIEYRAFPETGHISLLNHNEVYSYVESLVR